MPIDEKQIRFSASENVTPLMKRLRQESEQLGRDLIRDARAYTTSGKEALRFIEDQIRAIERRGRADKESRVAELDIARERGGIDPSVYKQRVSDITADARTDQQQVLLLRELIDTVKNTSRREIIEDRKNIEKQIKSDKSLEQLGITGDELEALKKTLQRAEIGDIKEKEVAEKERFRYGKVLERGSGVLGGVAGSRNQFYALAAGLALIPVVGQAASGLATRALGAAENYQAGLAGVSQLTGRRQSEFYGAGGDLTNIGYTKADFLTLNRRASIARGSFRESFQAARDVAFLERGTGFGQDIFLEQERLTRAGGAGSLAGTQRLTRGLQAIGAVQGQDISLLGEYLPILVNLQQEQVKIAGETNTEIATKLVTGIASLDESFKNPDVLRGVLPSVVQGARAAVTPQFEALQFRALSRINPGASLLDLEEMRENPTLQYIEALFEQLRGVSPNDEVFARNIRGGFGLSTSQARRAAAGFTRGGFDLGQFAIETGMADVQIRGGVNFGTGDLRASTAKFTEKFETVGQALTDAIQSMVGVGGDLKEGMIKVVDSITEARKQQMEVVEELSKSSRFIDRLNATLIQSRPVGFGPGK